MLIDDVTIRVYGGHGGAGEVAFSRTKLMKGPMGGNGGLGGSVYFKGTGNLAALYQFRFKKDIKAENGKNGRGYLCDGSDAPDITLEVPVGTVVENLDTKEKFEIMKIGETVLVAKGGIGGRGNFKFRNAINQAPRKAELGRAGKTYTLRLQLKMIADIGLIGLPNAGKSSLLNEISNAQSKVANYPFTTLEPHLGVYHDLIVADIPGIIEGASSGKGLGIKFLKHVERTKILFHLICADSKKPISDYKTIRKELGRYNKALLEKDEYIFVTKHDLLDKKSLTKLVTKLKKINSKVLPISIYDYDSIQKVYTVLNKINTEKRELE